jgi:hypothetical protein
LAFLVLVRPEVQPRDAREPEPGERVERTRDESVDDRHEQRRDQLERHRPQSAGGRK